VITHPLEDLRGIDLGERLRTGKRIGVRAEGRTPAEELWRIGSIEGAAAVGFADTGAPVTLDRGAPELELVREEHLLDAAVYSGGPGVLIDAAIAGPAPGGPGRSSGTTSA
jgi:formimidoylglutamate deiminase